jgi:hypothetical protein
MSFKYWISIPTLVMLTPTIGFAGAPSAAELRLFGTWVLQLPASSNVAAEKKVEIRIRDRLLIILHDDTEIARGRLEIKAAHKDTFRAIVSSVAWAEGKPNSTDPFAQDDSEVSYLFLEMKGSVMEVTHCTSEWSPKVKIAPSTYIKKEQ